MNIFYTSDCPYWSAMWLDDIRANKMITETAQMLSAAILRYDTKAKGRVYKLSFSKHPCTVWTGNSRQNYNWLLTHGLYLLKRKLMNKQPKEEESLEVNCVLHPTKHLKAQQLYYHVFPKYRHLFPDAIDFTEPPQCNPFKGGTLSTIESYRKTMNHKWNTDKIKLSWNTGVKPEWCSHET